MGLRGPPPTPYHLRVLQGNPGRRPLGAPPPTPAAVSPTPPVPQEIAVDMYAAALWQRLAPMLAGLGLLTEGDIDALSLLCQQHSIYRQCADMIRKEGIIVSHKNKAGAVNRVPHPALRVQHAAIQNIVKISARFGLTPSDRNGLGLAGEEPKDELDALAQA